MKTTTLPAKRFAPARGTLYRVYTWMWFFMAAAQVALMIYENWAAVGERVTIPWFFLSGFWVVWGMTIVYAWFNTYYELNENQLNYKSGFSKGSITVESIYKVEKTNYAVGAMKAALAGNGLLIHYNKFDDLYVAPKNKEEFLKELLRQNPDIEVKEDLEQKTKAA